MVEVAVAVIRQNEKILICKRGAGGSCAFLWEFPGGKREQGESFAQCLVRECREELEIDVKAGGVINKTTYLYPEAEVSLTFFDAAILRGTIKANVHEEIRWVTPEELPRYEFCPADREIVGILAQG